MTREKERDSSMVVGGWGGGDKVGIKPEWKLQVSRRWPRLLSPTPSWLCGNFIAFPSFLFSPWKYYLPFLVRVNQSQAVSNQSFQFIAFKAPWLRKNDYWCSFSDLIHIKILFLRKRCTDNTIAVSALRKRWRFLIVIHGIWNDLASKCLGSSKVKVFLLLFPSAFV